METNKELRTSKEFKQPVEKVFAAWTDPEQLKQWWKPMKAKLIEVRNELREGGEIEYSFSSEEQDFQVTGQYAEVKPNERLVYSWNWHIPPGEAEEYTLSINFISNESGCRLEVLQENFQKPEHVEPHQKGWEQGFSDLADYLEGNNSSRPAGTLEDHIPVVGYGS